ncbi:OLC1v1027524C1 [Oldenlandia corymbosa var. corymbosa]|uniref:OLC1v1027524C1 n=1 Tax=Oldenlandia corymbosa var. corymbosa TaxID=529605 RepID=A0AAV1C9P5_OLDCO|nr:OLC1v1027524C1 [Oldenlandia corymbosa var. corymbosa]
MAGRKDQTEVHPFPHTFNTNVVYDAKAGDRESANSPAADELRRKKRIKYLAYFAAFVVFQTGIILLFSLTVMKIKTPKFQMRSASFDTFDVGTAANPSFNLSMEAQFGIKNSNFGNYKFQNSTIYFFCDGSSTVPVGQAVVGKNKAGWRSTKKLDLAVDLSSENMAGINVTQLGSDISSGVLKLNARSKLSGKVELMFIFKKKKSTSLDCSITVYLADKTVREIYCK